MSNRLSSFPATPVIPPRRGYGGTVKASAELGIALASGDIFLVTGTAAIKKLPAAPVGTLIKLYCVDTLTFVGSSRLKLPGAATSRAFSAGTMAEVFSIGDGVWRVLASDEGGILTLWADDSRPDDSGDGRTKATAFKTLQAMFEAGKDHVGSFVMTAVDGHYTAGINIYSPTLATTTRILLSESGNPANCHIDSPDTAINVQDGAGLSVSGFKLSAVGAGLACRQFTITDFGNIQWGTCGTQISLADICICSRVSADEIVGNAVVRQSVGNGSLFHQANFDCTIATARAFTYFTVLGTGAIIDGAPNYIGAGVAGTTGQKHLITQTVNFQSVTYPGDAAGVAYFAPGADDGQALGTTFQRWSDLFLASGGVINFNNGAVAITNSGTQLNVNGGASIFNMTMSPTSGVANAVLFNDGAATLCGYIQIDATANTTTYANTSDERLKEKFDESGTDWGDKIDKLWVGDFERKSNPGVVELGVVAQRTQPIFPQAVSHHEESDTWGVDYGKLAPLGLWGVKELRARVADLEAKVTELMKAK